MYPAGMSVCALDHIVLDVANVEQSLHFYQTALGLGAERVDAWRRGEVGFPSLRINASTIIDLVSDSGTRSQQQDAISPTSASSPTAPISTRPSRAWRPRAWPSRPARSMRSGARGNALSIYFRDPDQNLIELRTYAGQA